MSIVDDIKKMRIRGAGRIARAAIKALKLVSESFEGDDREEFIEYIKSASKILLNTRPTAVSLPNALRYVLFRLLEEYRSGGSLEALKETVNKSVNSFVKLSKNALKKIGEYGARLIDDGDVILTHCNSAAVLSIIIKAKADSKNISVYATETRPRFQGRKTIKVLNKYGVRTTLIVDSAVGYFMNKINKVFVGADAILANGALINKIGTFSIAIIANEFNVPLYVAAETYKYSPDSLFGVKAKIEERSPTEVISPSFLSRLNYVKVRNPAFDITSPRYITAIISEVGIYHPSVFPRVAEKIFKFRYSELYPWE